MGGGASIHASCVAIGDAGVLIRGASGSGKSLLALRLILDPPRVLPAGELVADDRVFVEAEGAQVWAFAPVALAGLIEVRGLGIRRLPHRARVAVRHVVDLGSPDFLRMPTDEARTVLIAGVRLPRIVPERLETAALLVAAALVAPPHVN